MTVMYFSLCVIKYFLNIISPKNDMTAKIISLFADYPNIDIRAMGFTVGWENEPLWKLPEQCFAEQNSGNLIKSEEKL